ncbi:hypothetical protein F4778DRAFT_762835, partial [Xylariomycetidae sp. FL2044]
MSSRLGTFALGFAAAHQAYGAAIPPEFQHHHPGNPIIDGDPGIPPEFEHHHKGNPVIGDLPFVGAPASGLYPGIMPPVPDDHGRHSGSEHHPRSNPGDLPFVGAPASGLYPGIMPPVPDDYGRPSEREHHPQGDGGLPFIGDPTTGLYPGILPPLPPGYFHPPVILPVPIGGPGKVAYPFGQAVAPFSTVSGIPYAIPTGAVTGPSRSHGIIPPKNSAPVQGGALPSTDDQVGPNGINPVRPLPIIGVPPRPDSQPTPDHDTNAHEFQSSGAQGSSIPPPEAAKVYEAADLPNLDDLPSLDDVPNFWDEPHPVKDSEDLDAGEADDTTTEEELVTSKRDNVKAMTPEEFEYWKGVWAAWAHQAAQGFDSLPSLTISPDS